MLLSTYYFGKKYLHAVGYQHASQMFSDAPINNESLQNRLLKFCYVPATSASLNRLLFLLLILTVLMKQTRQAVCAIKQSIIVRCLWMHLNNLILIDDFTELNSFATISSVAGMVLYCNRIHEEKYLYAKLQHLYLLV